MADFGQLDDFLDVPDIKFTLKGKEYAITVAANRVLDFKRFWDETHEKDNAKLGVKKGDPVHPRTEENINASVARLLGGDFDTKAYRFEGGLVGELIEAGVSMQQLDKLLTTIWIQFQWENEELAQAFLKVGKLNEAIQEVSHQEKMRQVERDNQVKAATGETAKAD